MASTDPDVRAALSHWAPRLIANGVDYNDFQATIARIGRWADWGREWSATASVHEGLADEADARGARASAAEARVRAAICHHFGKFLSFDDPEHYRRAGRATVANYRRAAPDLDPPAERVGIPHDGSTLPGWLRLPRRGVRPPVALILCGLDSVKEEMNSLEPVLHARGLATLTFDGPGQGESEHLPIEPEFERVVASVLDWLARRRDVDGGRVGALGVSLGGYYAGRAAAFERRLRAAVSVGGPMDFGAIFATVPELTRRAFQVRSHSAEAAEAAEKARALTLADCAGRIERPFLIVFGSDDRLIPAAQAEDLHAAIPAPGKRLALLEGGNHVCNNMPYVWRPLAADWLAGQLGAMPAARTSMGRAGGPAR